MSETIKSIIEVFINLTIPVQTVVPPAASTSYADAVGVPGNAGTNQTASQPTNFRQLVSTAVAEERRDRKPTYQLQTASFYSCGGGTS